MDDKENKEGQDVTQSDMDLEEQSRENELISPVSIARELMPVSLETEMKRSYLDYAMSVIVGRALPDVRDGLKPVHRRVLYGMNELGNFFNREPKKSARIVGDVMGKYHPHGDSAIYMTIVRLAQPFSSRYPLVRGKGNFGSIDGDGPAAMRYTEVRLERISNDVMADIGEDTVDFTPNFDNSLQEPTVLPTRLPLLLINGSSGIAVGMATNIPPHNVKETVRACLHFLKNPDCTVDELIQFIPAPDFPTGGVIFGLSGVHQGYRTGRGRVVMRARTHFEEIENSRERTRIVIDEIPYMVNKSSLVEKIHELMRDKKVEGISEIRDESSEGIRICVDLKQGVMPDVVLNNLFKFTQLQETFGMNMVALVDGQPMLLNLKQMVEHFVAHRREVVTRRSVFRLNKHRKDCHLLEGQAVALHNLDEFIRVIRASATPKDAADALYSRSWPMALAEELVNRSVEERQQIAPLNMDRSRGIQPDGNYLLTTEQVENILSMNLRRLTNLEQDKIFSDYRNEVLKILDYLDILAKPERVNAIIAAEFQEIVEKYGDERRSSIDLLGDPNFDKRDLIARRDMVVTLSRTGYIKSQDLDDYDAQTRGGKGRKVQEMTKDDEITELFIANTHDIIMCFSTEGRVYPLDVFELPEGKSSARGRPIVNLLPLEEGEEISFILPVTTLDDDDHFVFMATDKGIVKKTPLSAFKNARTKGIIATTLDEDEHLVGVAITDGHYDCMLFSDAGKCVRFSEDDVRPMGRNAHGVIGMRLDEGQKLISLIATDCEDKYVLTATENGYGKRTLVEEYPRHSRGTKGVIAISTSERNGKVVSAVLTTEEDDLMLLSASGKLVRTKVAQVSIYSRSAQGVRLINLDDDVLASVRRIPPAEDEDEEALDPDAVRDEDLDEDLEDDEAGADDFEGMEDEDEGDADVDPDADEEDGDAGR